MHHHRPYNRRSIRLKGYDYSQAGLYFITICCQNQAHLFGNITAGEMKLNDAGQMVEKWYYELENKFPDIKCHEMIVMPNHFHCIVENTGVSPVVDVAVVGADLRVCPDNNTDTRVCPDDKSGLPDLSDERGDKSDLSDERGRNILGEHVGSPLRRVVQWFKTMTTNEYIRGVKTLGWEPFNKKIWQRNYYEHIIRNQQSYQRISEYIINNPKNWKGDKFNTL